MNIKTKKHNSDGQVRLETSGKLREILINEDFLNPKKAKISLCFKGKSSSGIIEITPKELEIINRKVSPSLDLLKNTKVMKFKK
jgi:hypothetical protein